ncbi:hypothetical protein [Sediminicurvatus halobius]|uniref:Uncharacterized protein n=1 Tax=Sediminicurvatus halobius TaxID=2182432 RepID=A0A2U2MYI0_9GAMM|nr:hypothetical protein [Spiribacter halobius]PWG61852.1 hypothetical protein DEM34_14695 [Spiribacter halobius]UEX77695.1 hypothetical protein LMH63_17460 [Spiribacter halobius]
MGDASRGQRPGQMTPLVAHDTGAAITVIGDIEHRRGAKALERWDVESPSDQLDPETKLPDDGLQLREEYVLYAHFNLLRRWLEAFDEAHFFVDQESGIRAAYMAAFHDWVLANRSHLFYTKVKSAPAREEREAAARERDEILEERDSNGGASRAARSSY